jgi:hypothetical protein
MTMYKFTKREIAMIVAAFLITGALTVWGTIFLIDKFIFDHSDDPIVKAGGLNPKQRALQEKK